MNSRPATFARVFPTAQLEQGGSIIHYKNGDGVNALWLLSGRGSTGDKAAIMVILNAYDALVKSKIELPHNMNSFLKVKKKTGQCSWEKYLKNKSLLQANLWNDNDDEVSGMW